MSLVTWGQFFFVKWGDRMKIPFLMVSMPKVNLCMHVTCSFDTFKLPSTHMKLNLLSLFSLDSNKNCQHLWWYLWGDLLLVLAQFLNENFLTMNWVKATSCLGYTAANVCIKYYVLSMFLCYNFYIDGNIPFWVSCFGFYFVDISI